jgi:PST family polysaccharide transporter
MKFESEDSNSSAHLFGNPRRENAMSRTKTALRSAIWVMAESWLVRVVSLVSFFVLAHLLTPKDFGLVALATVYFTFASFFVDQGFSTSLVQREELEDSHLDAVFWAQFVLGIVLAALSFFLAEPIASLLGDRALTPVLQALCVVPIISGLTLVQQAQLRRGLRFRGLAARRVLSTTAGAAIAIVLAAQGFGVWSLVAQTVGAALVSLVVFWRVSAWRPSLSFSFRHLRELTRFGAAVFAHDVISSTAMRIDRLLMGRFAGVGALGVYSVARRLDTITGEVLVVGLQKIVVPVFARVQNDRLALLRGLFRAHRLIAFVVLPAFAGLALTAPKLVPLLLGSKWLDTIPVVQAAVLPSVVAALGFFLGSIITAIGRAGLRLAISFVHALVATTLVLIALRWGPAAVALAMGFAALFAYILTIIALRRLIGLNVVAYHVQAWPAMAGTAVMAAAILWTNSYFSKLEPWMALVLNIVVGTLTYVAVTLILARDQWREMVTLATLVKGTVASSAESRVESSSA